MCYQVCNFYIMLHKAVCKHKMHKMLKNQGLYRIGKAP